MNILCPQMPKHVYSVATNSDNVITHVSLQAVPYILNRWKNLHRVHCTYTHNQLIQIGRLDNYCKVINLC